MTGVLASPPARAVDVRVAESPLVGIRFHLDARIGDLMQVIENVERERSLCTDRRSRLREHLRHNEEARRELLRSISRQSLLAVRRCLREGIETATELGRLDERLAGLSRLQASLLKELGVLRQLLGWVAALGGEEEIALDGRASRFSQARRRVFQLVEEEHSAVERALVDGPLQRLSGALLEAELAVRRPREERQTADEEAARCRGATEEASAELGWLIRRWRPLHGGKGLAGAIREVISDPSTPPTGHLRIIGAARRLPAEVELTAYRVVEEALENALRHGGASRADVILAYHRERLAVVVKDDGDGFDVAATEARLGRSRGRGIISMRSRAANIGGQCDVRSVIGAGTEVRASLPVVAAG